MAINDNKMAINNKDNDDTMKNYGTIFWIVLVTFLLWMVPLLLLSISNVWHSFRSRRATVVDGGEAVAPVVWVGFSRVQELTRMARDAFITIVGGLFVMHVIVGCIDRCVYASSWSLFAFFLVNYVMTLIGGRFNIFAPLWLLGFAASGIALFSCVFINFNASIYGGYKGIVN